MPEKCWLHRANRVEKIVKFEKKYQGFEVDVIFDNENLKYDVSHDKKESINLSLEEYFKYLNKNNKKFWIDFKNLDIRNQKNALLSLEKLRIKYNIDKERIILESPNYKELEKFKEKGYYVSFYITDDTRKINEQELKELKEKINDMKKNNKISAISFPVEYYPQLKDIQNIDFLTWEGTKEWEFLYKKKYTKIPLNDPKIKIFLVKEKSEYDR